MSELSLKRFVEMIDQGDFISMLFLILVLYIIGSWLTEKSPQAKQTAKKCSGITLLLYFIYAWVVDGAMHADVILSLLFRSLQAAGFIYGTSLIGYAVYSFGKSHFIDAAQEKIAQAKSAREKQIADEHQEKLDAEKAIEDQKQRDVAARLSRDKAAEQQALAHQADETESFRENVRFDLLLEYKSLRKEIQEILPEAEFREMIDVALNSKNAIEIRRRIGRLRKLLTSTREESVPKEQTLESISQEFTDRRADIEASPYDQVRKDKLIQMLNFQESMRINRLNKID